MNKILEAIEISKIYNARTSNPCIALDNVSLDIYEGEFICIMGPSGSGKSTFLNCISTIDLPTKGKVLINGSSIRKMSEGEIGKFRGETLGFIFQNYNMMETLSIFDNISLPLALNRVNKEEIKQRVNDIAIKLEIDTLLNKLPSECSGGQQQRVAIARALINNPKLVVADEPTGNLDSKNSHDVLNIINEINKNNTTVLMVSHDAVAASYSKKVIFIRDGKIAEVIERKDMNQKDYFKAIVEVNSSESLDLL